MKSQGTSKAGGEKCKHIFRVENICEPVYSGIDGVGRTGRIVTYFCEKCLINKYKLK